MPDERFKIGDGTTMMISVLDVHEESKAMARRLGMSASVHTMVGRWGENGEMIGWTKQFANIDAALKESGK